MAKTKQKKRRVQARHARKELRRKSLAASAHRSGGRGSHQLSLHQCIVNENYRIAGAAFVCLSRRRSNGGLAGAAFFVDLWGIGLKDCFRTDDVPASQLDFNGALQHQFGAPFVDCDEDLARQLVWGGVWRARREGFRLPMEFRSCKNLLARLDEGEVDWSLFGKGGETLIIGDLEDLERRSRDPLELDRDGRSFIVGCEPGDSPVRDNPWQELFEEDDLDLPPGKERVLFIEGTFYGENFQTSFSALEKWPDLDVVAVDEENENARFAWSRAYPDGHWSPFSQFPGARQSLGELRIEGEAVTVSVKGKSWMIIMMDRLLDEFEEGLELGPLQIKDPLEQFNREQQAG